MNQKNAGYTLDQTILIVSIMAVMSTLVVSQFGSNVIDRARGLKVASILQQVGQANQIFKLYHNAWPHELSRTGSATDNAMLLAGGQNRSQNLLPNFKVVNNTLQHDLGLGGEVAQSVMRFQGQNYIVISISNIPQGEAEAADKIIDGRINPTDGRLQYDATSQNLTTLLYLSTPIQ